MRILIQSIKNNIVSYGILSIGMIVTMLIISIGVSKANEFYIMSKDTVSKDGGEKYYISMNATEEDMNFEEIVQILDEEIKTFDIETEQLALGIADVPNISFIKFILNNNVDFIPPILKGRWFERGEKNVAVVGKNIEKEIGDILKIGNKEFKVIGKTGRTEVKNSIFDHGIYADIGSMPFELTRKLTRNSFFDLRANENSSTDEIDSFIKKIKEKNKSISIEVEKEEIDLNESKLFLGSMIDEMYNVISILLVALLNSIVISYFVIRARGKEILIRRVCGGTNKDIVKQIIIEFGFINIISAIISIIIQIIIGNLLKGIIDINLNYKTVIWSIVITLITSLIAITPSILKGIKGIPANELKE